MKQKDKIALNRRNKADEYIGKIHEYSSMSEAARAALAESNLFDNEEQARGALRAARSRAVNAANKGIAPNAHMTNQVAEGFGVKRVSSHFVDGDLKNQWIISEADKLKQKQIAEEAFQALASQLPRKPLSKAPNMSKASASLCNLYTITDAHLGMMATEGESGGDHYDLNVGEELFTRGFDALIKGAPKARKCVISQLGDFLHSDGLDAVTPASKHPLDQSHRFSDLVRAASRLLVHMVDTALATHEEVELVIAEGNHDESSAKIFPVMMEMLYKNEPRLKVIISDLPFYETTHGNVMLGFHHGHIKNIKTKAAANALALMFASGEAWKSTEKRYIHTGHFHEECTAEAHGVKLFGHPAFIPPDAYASRNFGGSMREMTSHTYHESHGKVGTNTITPEMLR